VSSILIERTAKQTDVIINTAKPGVVIGHSGEEIEKTKKELTKLVGENIQISIMEVKNPDLVAALVAESIARQIENRVSFRVAQKRAIRNTMRAGAKGIKTSVSGRLGGVDMARSEGYTEGNIPLHTLRADVDYSHKEADTAYGKIGVKVWIYKGEILPSKKKGGN
ncbi:MAG TPA: 30S ribosomal protein S3, partial [Tenericutes bacterium]|nr:30S ribosomal protein S3 [Mycoplasmatota bacterium]